MDNVLEYLSEWHPLQWIINHWALCGILVAGIAAVGKAVKWVFEVRKLRYDERRRTRADKIAEIIIKMERFDEKTIKERKLINVNVPEEIYLAEIKEDTELIREALRRRKEKTNLHFHQNPLNRQTL